MYNIVKVTSLNISLHSSHAWLPLRLQLLLIHLTLIQLCLDNLQKHPLPLLSDDQADIHKLLVDCNHQDHHSHWEEEDHNRLEGEDRIRLEGEVHIHLEVESLDINHLVLVYKI